MGQIPLFLKIMGHGPAEIEKGSDNCHVDARNQTDWRPALAQLECQRGYGAGNDCRQEIGIRQFVRGKAFEEQSLSNGIKNVIKAQDAKDVREHHGADETSPRLYRDELSQTIQQAAQTSYIGKEAEV
jgi:hypothetical protein